MNGKEICRISQNLWGASWRSDLCSVLAVSLRTVYRWEKGETEPLSVYVDLFQKNLKRLDTRKKAQ
jgi:DNA-binding transcriptional regulator YiaG